MRKTAGVGARVRACVAIIGVIGVAMALVVNIGAGIAKNTRHLKIAYLSFAVTNTYDAPMLAAAKKEAAANNTTLTVFDANNSPTTQFSQFQDAIATGSYQGIITQPILSTNLIPLVREAAHKGIKVVNMDQTMGPSLSTPKKQVPGLAGNVAFVPTTLGYRFGTLVVQACKAKHLKPCNVGYMYDIKASALDGAIRSGFNQAIRSDSSIHVVAEGQDFFTPTGGATAAQQMLTADPSINLIAASDQGIEGTSRVTGGHKLVLVGFGGSAAGLSGVKSGAWYGTVMQDPSTEGRIATEEDIAAIRTGKGQPAINPLASYPNYGIVTKANVSKFHAEWPG
jgi:ribose transport system substrate-binding protein